MTSLRHLCLLFFASLSQGLSAAEPAEPDWARIGLTHERLEPGYWLTRASSGERVLISAQTIAERNERLLRTEPSMVHWPSWPASLPPEDIRRRIETLTGRLNTPLFRNADTEIAQAEIDAWLDNRALERIEAADDRLFGLVVKRAAVRRLPSAQRAFDRNGGIDIDRLQESALFPGTPVAVLHESRDGRWLFVQAENYAGWVETDAVGIAGRAEVMRYAARQPRRHITGSQVRTVYHPYAEEVSELRLDMGASFPLRTDWPLSKPVNGQGALGAWIIDVPLRLDNGMLHIKPALIPRAADTAAGPLPASQANLIRQAFKFLGERYGWGHDYQGRDCSGFVSEIYRSLGIRLPRNTGDQARTPVFERIAYGPELGRAERLARLKQLRIGDLVFIPGHVMLVVGHDEFGPWVIHDAHRSALMVDGRFTALPMNGVGVTPLLAMALSEQRLYADAVTAVQRILSDGG